MNFHEPILMKAKDTEQITFSFFCFISWQSLLHLHILQGNVVILQIISHRVYQCLILWRTIPSGVKEEPVLSASIIDKDHDTDGDTVEERMQVKTYWLDVFEAACQKRNAAAAASSPAARLNHHQTILEPAVHIVRRFHPAQPSWRMLQPPYFWQCLTKLDVEVR